MKCRTCGSAMVVDHRESGGRATASWHSCPLCNTRRLMSEPDQHVGQRAEGEELDLDDDGTFAMRQPAYAAFHS